MKKIFSFKKKKGSPSPSETGSVLSASYDVKEKDLGKLHKAAFSGDVAKIRQLAKKNDLNQLDKEHRTALHIACACGHTDVVQFLVESKVKLNLCDNQNRSALMKAVQCEQDRSVSLLLEHEADPNLVDISGNTALHLAARIPSLPVVLQLLEHSANINAQNKDGNTPLMLAVMENHADMTELLLKEGAEVNVKNQEQRSALMMAACNGQISMVRLLLQYDADITVKDDKGWSSDDYAVMNGHHACSHLIIEHGTKRRSLQSPSHFTASKKKQTSVLGSPGGIGAGLALGGPALDKDGESNCVLLDLHDSRFSASSVYVRQYCCSVDCSVLIWFCFPVVTPHSSVVAAGSSSAGAGKGIANVCQSMCCRSDIILYFSEI
uniref:Si:ch211-272n13.3 n=1 Tax=Cyprinus carpio TaxID=7962 RepID=A0A8C1SFZ3_CYPCA